MSVLVQVMAWGRTGDKPYYTLTDDDTCMRDQGLLSITLINFVPVMDKYSRAQ